MSLLMNTVLISMKCQKACIERGNPVIGAFQNHRSSDESYIFVDERKKN